MKLNLYHLSNGIYQTPLGIADKVEVLRLIAPYAAPAQSCIYVCLQGEVVIDLPLNEFIHLKPNESYSMTAGTARVLTPIAECLLLQIQT